MRRPVRAAVMGVMLAGAAWLALFGDKTPAGAVVAARAPAPAAPATRAAPTAVPAPTAPTAPTAPARGRAAAAPVPIEALQPRAAPPGDARATGADLFINAPWRAPPRPVPVAVPAASAATPVPAPPPVPPQPYRLLGKKLEAEAWEVFLGRGDLSFIARVGDTLEGAWRVQAIEPPTLTLSHLPSGQQQTLDIGPFP